MNMETYIVVEMAALKMKFFSARLLPELQLSSSQDYFK